MAKKQKNITIASYNYLQEVSAIPSEIRYKYLDTLSKRKSSSRQKNYLLLKIIYDFVDNNKASQWNPSEICSTLNISKGALYIHKSRLLKGLRLYFFNWDSAEKEIESKFINETKPDNKQKINIDFEKLRKMAVLGMGRESKNLCLKLTPLVRRTFVNSAEKYLMLSEIYEYLIYYYYSRRKKKMLRYYKNVLEDAFKAVKTLNMSISNKQNDLFSIRIYYAKFYLSMLKLRITNDNKPVKDYCKKIYALAKKINDSSYILRILHSSSVIYMNEAGYDEAIEFCMEGCSLAKTLKYENEFYAFAAQLYYLKLMKGTKNLKLNIEDLLQHYYKIKSSIPVNRWTVFTENFIVMNYYPDKRKDVQNVFRQLINSSILMGDYSFAVYWKFTLDYELYMDELLKYYTENCVNEESCLESSRIDDTLLNKMKDTALNTMHYHKELNDMNFIWRTNFLHLLSYYFRENDFDYNKMTWLMNKFEQVKKINNNLIDLGLYEILKLCILILEESDNKTRMANKYEFRLKNLINDIKNGKVVFNITGSTILSSLIRRVKSKNISGIVNEFHKWLNVNHPEILAPIFREIEQRKSNVHTIGTEEAA